MLRIAFAILLVCSLGTPATAVTNVDLQLVLAADSSGSIDEEEFALQRRGYAEAITNEQVLGVIQSGLLGRIALAYVEWAAPDSIHTIVDWQVVDGTASARAFADALLTAPRVAFGYNSISNAMRHAADMIATNGFESARRIIDISGDGPQMNGAPLPEVRAKTLAAGITVNALAIRSPGGGYPGPRGEPLEIHYMNDVVGGPGAFVMVAEGFDDFARAIIAKLVREIALAP